MRLLHDKILVEPITEVPTKGGLIIPQSAHKRNTGKVLLVSEKCKVVKNGDMVKYHEHSGVSINHEGKDCLLLSETNQVIAVLND